MAVPFRVVPSQGVVPFLVVAVRAVHNPLNPLQTAVGRLVVAAVEAGHACLAGVVHAYPVDLAYPVVVHASPEVEGRDHGSVVEGLCSRVEEVLCVQRKS